MDRKDLKIFLCHSRRDTGWTDLITRSLEKSNYKLWKDEDIKPGENWYEAIQHSLEMSKIFLLFITPESFESKWTQFEIGAALGRASTSNEVRVIPVILGDTEERVIPKSIRDLDCLYAKNWNFEQLIEQIRKKLKEIEIESTSGDPNKPNAADAKKRRG